MASQSPALAGRYGSSFLRLLRKKSKHFQGTPRQYMWLNVLIEINKYNGAVRHGIVLDGEDGLPAVLVWAHCDDFTIHGPTETKTKAATIELLDLAVDVGMLCHPGKLTPEAHIVKYTGFLFDTTTEPSLRISVSNREKAPALFDFVVRHREKVSSLGLAKVTGILESLSEATTSHIGRAYLRKLYKVIHPEGWEEDDLAYFSWANLADDLLEDLLWWRHALLNDSRRCCRLHKAGTLSPSFGDGSGTGTGGSVRYDKKIVRAKLMSESQNQYFDKDVELEMWMGAWSPHVFHHSSSWKELRILLKTLERASDNIHIRPQIAGTTFFYFTDNMVSYHIVQSGVSNAPGLHKLVLKIKKLQLDLQCHLEMVHVSGTTMIPEGKDGLSRGVWMTHLQSRPNYRQLMSEIFQEVPFSQKIADWARNEANIECQTPWYHVKWNKPWIPHGVFDLLAIWFPPPEVAYQLLYFLLTCWTERPLTTSALIVLPRILQRQWSRVSQQLREVGTYQKSAEPGLPDSHLMIPTVVLLIPTHGRIFPPRHRRLDETPSISATVRWHRQQAELLREIPVSDLSTYYTGSVQVC
jgi:hypothetical protein